MYNTIMARKNDWLVTWLDRVGKRSYLKEQPVPGLEHDVTESKSEAHGFRYKADALAAIASNSRLMVRLWGEPKRRNDPSLPKK